RRDVLERHLHVAEPEGTEACETLAAQGDPARDEVRVEIERPGSLDQRFEIVANERLATREMKLDDAELLGFAEDAEPLRRVEPVHVTAVIQGVRAIHAAERASVCELGDERIRTVLVVHGSACIRPRSVSVARNDMTSRYTQSSRCHSTSVLRMSAATHRSWSS